MRVVIDINIFVSALIVPAGKPADVIRMWLDGEFTLLACAMHVNELRATLHKPGIAELIEPHKAGRLVNKAARIVFGRDFAALFV